MKKTLLLIAACCFAVAVTAQSSEMQASITRGKVVFDSNCLVCHQADGKGVPMLAPPLAANKRVMGDDAYPISNVLKGKTGEIDVNGTPFNGVMPAQAFLTDQQIADVLTFVRNSFQNKAAAVTVARVKEIRATLK